MMRLDMGKIENFDVPHTERKCCRSAANRKWILGDIFDAKPVEVEHVKYGQWRVVMPND